MIAGYEITLRYFDEFCGGVARMGDLNDTQIAEFAGHRLQGVSRGTVKRDMNCLLALARFAFASGHTKSPVLLRAIHAPVPTPIALSREQIESVHNAIRHEIEAVVISYRPRLVVPGNVWWEALFLVCWDTAERFTPVFSLKECNLSLSDRWVRFLAEDRKGGKADSVKTIAEDTAAALERLLAFYPNRKPEGRVFRWAPNESTVWRRLGDIMLRAGLPDTREFKFHSIRKSSVTHLHAAGGDGCAHAGHSSDVITRRHYLDPRIARGADATELLFRPGASKAEIPAPQPLLLTHQPD
jgi:integrase